MGRENSGSKKPQALSEKRDYCRNYVMSPKVRDLGDILLATPVHDKISGKLRNVDHVVDGCRTVFRTVSKAVREGYFPLVIGGDCSLFPDAVAGLASAHRGIGVVYLDGQYDFHIPRLPDPVTFQEWVKSVLALEPPVTSRGSKGFDNLAGM